MVGQLVPPTPHPPLPLPEPDLSHILTEDDTPVDNLLSEKQQRLLTSCLYSGLKREEPFLVMANVGLFYGLYLPPIVPDVLLSLGVKAPEDWRQKKNRSYFVWEFGKAPEVVIEIVSNTIGNELGKKLVKYAQVGVAYYAVFDPLHCLGDEVLQVYQLVGLAYQKQPDAWLAQVGLGLTLWDGEFEGAHYEQWLRWCDETGNLLLTGDEQAAVAQAEVVDAWAEASAAQARVEQLAALLRAQGIDPDGVEL
ncbi:MAG: Uma2 family endonuclease [Cyanobacteria bacterium P01_G01_bin.54]